MFQLTCAVTWYTRLTLLEFKHLTIQLLDEAQMVRWQRPRSTICVTQHSIPEKELICFILGNPIEKREREKTREKERERLVDVLNKCIWSTNPNNSQKKENRICSESDNRFLTILSFPAPHTAKKKKKNHHKSGIGTMGYNQWLAGRCGVKYKNAHHYPHLQEQLVPALLEYNEILMRSELLAKVSQSTGVTYGNC